MVSFKYNQNNKQVGELMKHLSLLIILLLLFGITPTVNAEVIIYDNLTTTPYKTFTLDDDMNIAYIMEYGYKVYINDQYLGEFKKGQSFEYPDNSNITIYVPSPIKTDLNKGIDLGSSLLYIAVLGLLSFGIIIYLIYRFIRKFRR